MSVKRLYKREVYKTKDAWLKQRGLGGSSASALFGCNKNMTPLDIYKSIMFPKEKTIDIKTECMEYGIKCEPLIRKVFELDFGNKYTVLEPKNYEMYRHIKKPFLTATLDGVLINKETKEKLVLEIKTHDIRSKSDELNNWTNSIPQNYFCQVCHYLNIMNDFVGAILVAKLRFFNGNEIERTETRYYRIYRKDILDSIKALDKKETDFWNDCVLKKQPPSISINI